MTKFQPTGRAGVSQMIRSIQQILVHFVPDNPVRVLAEVLKVNDRGPEIMSDSVSSLLLLL